MTTPRLTIAGKKVLVVEDDYFIAKNLVRHLAASGAEVLGPVPTVAEALALIEAESIDGAVLDINLRGDLVFPVADALLERGVPFIFATGYGSGSVPERYATIVRCEKPVEPDRFIPALFA
jgi:DNA-binding response OmpR family regulator